MNRAVRRAFFGHFWTVTPHLAHVVRPTIGPRDEPWDTTVIDPDVGPIRLTGWLRKPPGADACVVVIHGLGGSADSRYMIEVARAADAAGLAYLRLNMRGADRSGEDFYHAGLTVDLRAALASPALAAFSRLYVVGYSLGGHVALRWAAEPGRDPRVRAVVAICSPLNLGLAVRLIQRPFGRPYQWYVLRGLKEMYRAAAARRRASIIAGSAASVGGSAARANPYAASLSTVLAIRTLPEWDELVVTPRFGFASPQAYYELTSAGPVLGAIDVPTLFIAAEADPMVTAEELRPWLAGASKAVEVAWTERGGHVGFPDDLDLGFGDVGPLEPQVVRWLLRHR